MIKNKILTVLIGLILCALPSLGSAKTSSNIVGKVESQIQVLMAEYPSEKDQPISAGILFDQADNWHIYWKIPGDAGIAPTFDYSYSDNIKSFEVLWPTPERYIVQENIENFIYPRDIIMPVKIIPNDYTKPVNLKLYVTYAACNKVCIPVENYVELQITPGIKDLNNSLRIQEFIYRTPQENAKFGLAIDDAHILEKNNVFTLEVKASATEQTPFYHSDLLVEYLGDDLKFRKPEVLKVDDLHNIYVIPIEVFNETGAKFLRTNQKLKLLLTNEELYSVEKELTLAGANVSWANEVNISQNQITFFVAVIFAFIGGLILNLMPCVLPVISIKLLSVLSHSGRTDYKALRFNFLLSAIGIISCFMVIAGSLIYLQSLGKLVGLGFQFQEPIFMIAIILLVSLFGMNLLGVFEINLPSSISTFVLTHSSAKSEALSHFLSGAFATILATPCTAPFVGAAIGYALSKSPYEIMFIFMSMGVGMSLPFLLISIFPKTIKLLPKPGRWMTYLRKFLSILLFATALWLLWVFSNQISTLAAYTLLLLILVLNLLLLNLNKLKLSNWAKAVLLASVLSLSFILPLRADMVAITSTNDYENLWIEFDEDIIHKAVSEGKVVVIDVTAKWCLTCQINKLVVFQDKDVMQTLASNRIIAMRADMTSANPDIIRFLKRHNRQGVPFNMIFGPKVPNGIVLNEIMSKNDFLSRLKEAGY